MLTSAALWCVATILQFRGARGFLGYGNGHVRFVRSWWNRRMGVVPG